MNIDVVLYWDKYRDKYTWIRLDKDLGIERSNLLTDVIRGQLDLCKGQKAPMIPFTDLENPTWI